MLVGLQQIAAKVGLCRTFGRRRCRADLFAKAMSSSNLVSVEPTSAGKAPAGSDLLRRRFLVYDRASGGGSHYLCQVLHKATASPSP